MSTHKHTPGPWSIDKNTDRDSYWAIDGRGWGSLAEVVVEVDGETSKEGGANARLIAAAPEMLEALEYLYGILIRSDDYYDGHGGRTIDEKLEIARKVIAKATGAV